MTRVVVDSSSVIGLSLAGQLDLLRQLFGRIDVPGEVYDEVVTSGSQRTGEAELMRAKSDGWVTIHPTLADPPHLRGEEAVIQLAASMQAKGDKAIVVLDESPARAQAARAGLKAIGTGGLLLLAKENGLIDSIRPSLDVIRTGGFRLHPELYQKLLTLADEA